MDKKLFWNDVAKYGLLLGIVMSGSKILEQSMVLSGNMALMGWALLEWVLFAVLFFVILYRATKKRAALADPIVGYRYMQGVNYMILVSVFAAVPVACIYYVYINSIIGYENYVEGLIGVIVTAIESQPVDATTADAIEGLIDQLRMQAQPSIFTALINTIFQYAFAGLFAGLILAGSTKRQPEIFENKNE